jgi:hypothetical protein
MILSSMRSVKGKLVEVLEQQDGGVLVVKADRTTTLYAAEEWADLSAAAPAFNAAAKVADVVLP